MVNKLNSITDLERLTLIGPLESKTSGNCCVCQSSVSLGVSCRIAGEYSSSCYHIECLSKEIGSLGSELDTVKKGLLTLKDGTSSSMGDLEEILSKFSSLPHPDINLLLDKFKDIYSWPERRYNSRNSGRNTCKSLMSKLFPKGLRSARTYIGKMSDPRYNSRQADIYFGTRGFGLLRQFSSVTDYDISYELKLDLFEKFKERLVDIASNVKNKKKKYKAFLEAWKEEELPDSNIRIKSPSVYLSEPIFLEVNISELSEEKRKCYFGTTLEKPGICFDTLVISKDYNTIHETDFLLNVSRFYCPQDSFGIFLLASSIEGYHPEYLDVPKMNNPTVDSYKDSLPSLLLGSATDVQVRAGSVDAYKRQDHIGTLALFDQSNFKILKEGLEDLYDKWADTINEYRSVVKYVDEAADRMEQKLRKWLVLTEIDS